MRNYFSQSQINLYGQCSQKYFYKYVKGLRGGPTDMAGIVIGVAFHNWIANELRDVKVDVDFFTKCVTEKLLDGSIKRVTTSEMFDGDYSKYMTADDFKTYFLGYDEELKKGTVHRPSLYEIYASVVNFARDNIEYLLNGLNISGVETELIEEIGGKELKGIYDVIGIKADGTPVVIDWKTTKKSWGETGNKLQDAIYSMIYKKRYGVIPEFRYVVFSYSETTGNVKGQIFTVKHTEETLAEYESQLTGYIQGIVDGVFIKNEEHWGCSRDYCEYYDICQPHKITMKGGSFGETEKR